MHQCQHPLTIEKLMQGVYFDSVYHMVGIDGQIPQARILLL